MIFAVWYVQYTFILYYVRSSNVPYLDYMVSYEVLSRQITLNTVNYHWLCKRKFLGCQGKRVMITQILEVKERQRETERETNCARVEEKAKKASNM